VLDLKIYSGVPPGYLTAKIEASGRRVKIWRNVCSWHFSDLALVLDDVRSQEWSGNYLPATIAAPKS
jgi:hypothetical protein